MAILLDETSRVCVLGATGSVARVDVARAVAYGTAVVCGVAPGHGGEELDGVPLFDTPAEAMRAAPFDAAVAYLPPAAYRDAMVAMIDVAPAWIAVVTEGVAIHDNVAVLTRARQRSVRIVGPSINGLISPGRAKVGFVDHVGGLYRPGGVGVISRSGGTLNEIAHQLAEAGLGISTALGIGGDAIVGTSPAELAVLFDADPATQLLVLYGEAGPDVEGELTVAIRDGHVTKPIVALVAGDWLTAYPAGRTFGHAGSFLDGEATTAAAKRRRLADAGVIVVHETADIGPAARRALAARDLDGTEAP